MIFNSVSILFCLVFFLLYHVATNSAQFNYFPFLIFAIVFFVLINRATMLETHNERGEMYITKKSNYIKLQRKKCNRGENFMNNYQDV